MGVLPLRKSVLAYCRYRIGLGNRLRVVLSAQSLAEMHDRAFYYVWTTGPEFGPRLDDLWDYQGGRVVSRVASRALSLLHPYEDETLRWLTGEAQRRRLWQIFTSRELRLPKGALPWPKRLRQLQTVEPVARAVDDFFAAHLKGTPYVGVMIRAHGAAHSKTQEASPMDWFVTRMVEISAAQPGTRFFLSCDDAEVQQDVISRVPDCVAQSDKGAYNSVSAVRAAVVDSYLLACSGYLLAPHWSSFVRIAEHLAGGRLTLENSTHGKPGPVDYTSAGLVDDPLRPYLRR